MKLSSKTRRTCLLRTVMMVCYLFAVAAVSHSQRVEHRARIDDDMNVIEIHDYYNENGNLERRDSVIKYKDGGKFETKTYFIGGDTVLHFQSGYDNGNNLVYERFKGYDINGKMESDSIVRRSPGGKAIWKSVFDPDSKTYKRYVLKGDKWTEIASVDAKPKENYATADFPVREIYGCPPKFQLSAGYSYVRAENGAAGLSMPLGANVSAVYKLSSKVGLALDASYHYRKKDDQKWDRQYLLAGPQFQCMNANETGCAPFGHIMAGYGRDGFSYMGFKNSGSGFVAAIGGGLHLKLGDKSFVKIKADALPVFFTDDMKIDYRLGVGWGIGTECLSPAPKKTRR